MRQASARSGLEQRRPWARATLYRLRLYRYAVEWWAMKTPRDPDPEDLLPLSPQVFHILAALAGGDQHGYGIMQEVASRTAGKLRLSPGTLYGSIKRMLEHGLIAELSSRERPEADDDERRRYYRLTPFGRKVAKAEAARLAELLEQARGYGLAPKRS